MKINLLKRKITLLLTLMGLNHAVYARNIVGNGQLKQETRGVTYSPKLHFKGYGKLKVIVEPAKKFSVAIEAEESLLPFLCSQHDKYGNFIIGFYQEGAKIINRWISSGNNYHDKNDDHLTHPYVLQLNNDMYEVKKPIVYRIKTPRVESISISDTVQVILEKQSSKHPGFLGGKQKSLKIHTKGDAKVVFPEQVNLRELHIKTKGGCHFDFGSLIVEDAVEINTKGSAGLYWSGILKSKNLDINAKGDIDIKLGKLHANQFELDTQGNALISATQLFVEDQVDWSLYGGANINFGGSEVGSMNLKTKGNIAMDFSSLVVKDQLGIVNKGMGNIKLGKGSAKKACFNFRGNCHLDAYDFNINEVDLTARRNTKCWINVKDYLHVNASNSSQVMYKSPPKRLDVEKGTVVLAKGKK